MSAEIMGNTVQAGGSRVVSDRPELLDDEDRSFAEHLRLAIARRGLSLDRLLVRLEAGGVDISLSTLSKWQTGASKPGPRSLPALTLLENELGLRPGDLQRRIGDQAARGRRLVPGPCNPVCRTLGLDLGLTPLHCDVSSVHIRAQLDAEGRLRRFQERLILTARTDHLSTFDRTAGYLDLVGHMASPFSDTGAAVQANTDPNQASRWRITLPRPLLRGQASLVEWGLDLSAGPALTTLSVCTNIHYRQVVIELAFPIDGRIQVLSTATRLDNGFSAVRTRTARGGKLVEAFTHPFPGGITMNVRLIPRHAETLLSSDEGGSNAPVG